MSWLPSIPSISSTSLQSRFISFILRRTLGRFTQLNDHQIDSQIGSGFVTVKDVTLSDQAINQILASSNVPVTLETGVLGNVVVRIPWPNPLTGIIGLEVEDLDLTLRLSPNEHPTPDPSVPDIVQSVASLSETFIHDELNDQEERALRESISSFLPGALGPDEDDPFLANPTQETDKDPEGVSVFASLLERLIARFQFAIKRVKIILVAPGEVRWILRIGEICYASNSENERKKQLVIKGVTLSLLDTETSTRTPISRASPYESPYDTPAPHSPASSSSSLDENTQLMMSTSLASLPPRSETPPPPLSFASLHPSPPEEDSDVDTQSSVGGSVYQSAIGFSTTASVAGRNRTPSPGERTPPAATTPQSLSPSRYVPGAFASSPPIPSIQPLPVMAPQKSVDPPPIVLSRQPFDTQDLDDDEELILSLGNDSISITLVTPAATAASDPMQLSISMGVLTLALHASMIKRALELLDSLQGSPTPLPPAPRNKPGFVLHMDATASLRGIVILVYPKAHQRHIDLTSFTSSPLVPPKVEVDGGYIRLWVDNIHLETQISPDVTLSTIVQITDISAFAFSCNRGTLVAEPLLITDPALSSRSDVVDWTDKEKQRRGAKVSAWRTTHRHSSSSRSEPYHAIKASLVAGEIEVDVVPLHVFLNIDAALDPTVSGWLTDAFAARQSDKRNMERISQKAEQDEQRRRIVEELDLGMDYGFDDIGGHAGPSTAHSQQMPQTKTNETIPSRSTTSLKVHLSLVRLETRCSPPPSAPESRSGSLILDLHSIRISAPPSVGTSRTRTRFASNSDDFVIGVDKLAQISFNQISISYAPVKETKAKQLVSISSLIFESTPPSSPKSTHDYFETGHTQFGGAPLRQGSFMPPATPKKGTSDSPRPGGTISGSPSSPKPLQSGVSPSLKEPKIVPPHLSRENSDSTALLPKLSINRSKTASLVLIVDFPLLTIDMTKPALDGLQYWADDLAQFLERSLLTPGDDDDDDANTERGAESVIGSRFFTQSRRSGSTRSFEDFSRETEGKGDMVIKVSVTETRVKALVPRAKEAMERPFEILASDIDLVVETKPEGKDETRITVDMMDITLKDADASGTKQTLLCHSPSQSLITASQSLIKLRFTSSTVPGTTAKESRIQLTLARFTYNFFPDLAWIEDLAQFAKAPPGAFEGVPPSERTKVSLRLVDGSLCISAPNHAGALLIYLGEASFSADMIGGSDYSQFVTNIGSTSILFIDDVAAKSEMSERRQPGVFYWIKNEGYALVAELHDTVLVFAHTSKGVDAPHSEIRIDQIRLKAHLCADTLAEIIHFGQQLASAFQPPEDKRPPKPKREPSVVTEPARKVDLLASIEDMAFKIPPEIGPTPDLINDDLPTNLDYLDQSFGAGWGFREIMDEDLDNFDEDGEDYVEHDIPAQGQQPQVGTLISKVGGETIRMLQSRLNITEHHFDALPPESTDGSFNKSETSFQIRVNKGDITLCLYDGYDWLKTRKAIETEVKQMRKRLAKIRQLVATGQTQDPTVEDTSALLFNSVYIGLEENAEELDSEALITAIDKELQEVDDVDTASQSSWQSFKPAQGAQRPRSLRVRGQRLTRSKGTRIEFCLSGLYAAIDQLRPGGALVSRTFITLKELEILDRIRTSTWDKFLTGMRTDFRGNIRETDSNMVQIELKSVKPVPDHPSEEARLRAKILPLRLYVDQDALDFLKKFFAFKDPNLPSSDADSGEGDGGIYFQMAEVFPVGLKLDYKPRRVDYRALRDGKTIELMNFFHFDGAEMTLRHIALTGITGWPRFFDLLNDLWTPDVKATQLAEVISGVAPIRSVVNVGSGVADLILLPIAQYKKDGRVVRGLQKGTTAFVKSTAMEAIKLGARLATGTQVILEQVEGALGNQTRPPITTEAVDEDTLLTEDRDEIEPISRYAQQPTDVREGVQSAYKSLRRNLNSAAQTILAVPMEVYEKSGSEGPVRAVVRAVPIAVLRPMIGASEAVSKTLLGLHNTLDPDVRRENEVKYKHH